MVTWRSIPNLFNSHNEGGEVEVKKRWICVIFLFQFDHIMGEEQERGRRSDVGRIVASELHVLIVEGQSYLHDVLDKKLGEGDTVEVFHFVKLLDDFHIGLKGLYLGSQIFGNFLNRFLAREEVKDLVDVTAKDVNTAELLN